MATAMAAMLIYDLRGDGPPSPEDGNVHTIKGVVVGDFQAGPGNDQLSGFFAQEEGADRDADDAISEGVFVYEGGTSLLDVAIGDTVRLTGEVGERYDLTELSRCSSNGAATAASVMLPENTRGISRSTMAGWWRSQTI